VTKIKPNAEFGEIQKGDGNVIAAMLHQTKSLIKNHPRSIIIISILQFGIYFVSNGMLLFFPDILNQTAKANQTDVKLCAIVEEAIKVKNEKVNAMCDAQFLELDSYYYAIILESCYVIGFLIISTLVNFVGRLAIFSFIFFTTSICGFAINYVSTTTGTYLYVWLLSCGINNTLLNTVTYDLFPTNLRSLAMSLSLMFGRFGALVGANSSGILLEKFCDTTFTISGAVLLISGLLTFLIPNIFKRK
jgi:MFS family permease